MTTLAPVLKTADVSNSFRRRLSFAANDIVDGLGRWRLWSALAWEDIRSTYRRSLFGILWITLSFAAFIFVKLLIFIPIMADVDYGYYSAYLMIGFFVWQFMATEVNSAPMVFVNAEGWIKNDPLPLSVYVFQAIARSLFNLLLSSLVVVVVLIYLQRPVTSTALLIIPALALYILNAIWIRLLLGVICARYRDLMHLVQTIMRIMFFMTPIFWLPEQMGGLMKVLWWNPFAHFIWIFRTPLLDGDPALASWAFTGAVTIVGWTIAFAVFALYRRRVVFWF